MPVKCRKCGGDHFTSKCGKDKKPENNLVEKKLTPEKNISESNSQNKKHFNVKNKRRSKFRKPIDSSVNEKTFKIKINNLPADLTLQNLNKMMLGWGRIGDIKLRRDDKTSYALIDFFDKEARDYFIEAINGTPMGFMILQVTK